jgi:hypothetical protein
LLARDRMDRLIIGVRSYELAISRRLETINAKTDQFKLTVENDNYDTCETANIKISGRQNHAKRALTCYGGYTHERLLSEPSRPYMLAYYLHAPIDCA